MILHHLPQILQWPVIAVRLKTPSATRNEPLRWLTLCCASIFPDFGSISRSLSGTPKSPHSFSLQSQVTRGPESAVLFLLSCLASRFLILHTSAQGSLLYRSFPGSHGLHGPHGSTPKHTLRFNLKYLPPCVTCVCFEQDCEFHEEGPGSVSFLFSQRIIKPGTVSCNT